MENYIFLGKIVLAENENSKQSFRSSSWEGQELYLRNENSNPIEALGT